MADGKRLGAVVVGSGFGGSVMAYRLAKERITVRVLERGKRYPPGSFARSPKEMQTNFWDPSAGTYGLFQIWRFAGIDGVVSAGLGGGSLIYANVLIEKDEKWFVRRNPDGSETPWPVTRADLDEHYQEAKQILAPQIYPLDVAPYSATRKTLAFREAADKSGLQWELPKLAITFGDPEDDPKTGEPIRDAEGRTTENLHHKTRYTCRLCGECDIGCNYGSKNTLDYNYLTLAENAGAEIHDLCEVHTLKPENGGGFRVGYVVHDPDGDRPAVEKEVLADRLILSAGTFGSTYLLLKNHHNFADLQTNKLGHFFSGNGDFLGFLHDAKQKTDGVTTARPLAPSHGPVITSTIRVKDTRDGGDGPGFYLQDAGYPGLVDWLVEATNATGLARRAVRFVERRVLDRLTGDKQTDLDDEIERLLGDAHRSSSLMPLLGMGLDTADGVMSINNTGELALAWGAKDSPIYSRINAAMQEVARNLDAEFLDDPIWYFHNRLITVHPLGGCSMGTDPTEGVVDEWGQVFGYKNFVIADGSVMPGPVGPNPSFTIAALANRFATHLIETKET